MSQEQPPNLETVLGYYVRHYGMTYEEAIKLMRDRLTHLSREYKAYFKSMSSYEAIYRGKERHGVGDNTPRPPRIDQNQIMSH
jgi:hypothetical protein